MKKISVLLAIMMIISSFGLVVMAEGAPDFSSGFPADFDPSMFRQAIEITGPYEIEETDVECESHGLTLRGKLVTPVMEGDEKLPMVVLAHGFMNNYSECINLAEKLGKNGIASVRFSLTGMADSDGAYKEGTFTSQKEDILNVFAFAKSLDFVDTNNLFLVGRSQGGLNSAMAAVDCADELNAICLWYPAFCIPADFNRGFVMFAEFDTENVPDELYLTDRITVGKAYIEEGMAMKPVEEFTSFEKDVLIIHGDNDTLVPHTYSIEMAEAYPNAQLLIMEGGGHGFAGDQELEALEATLKFVQEHIIP